MVYGFEVHLPYKEFFHKIIKLNHGGKINE
jgi:hypothetical protein